MKLNKKLLLGLGTSAMITVPMATVIACGSEDNVSELNITAADFTVTATGEDGVGTATVVWKTTKYDAQADFTVNKTTNLSNEEVITITVTPKTGFTLSNDGIVTTTITGLTAATAREITIDQSVLEKITTIKGTSVFGQGNVTLDLNGILGVTLSTTDTLTNVQDKATITIKATPNNPLFTINGTTAGAKDITFTVNVPVNTSSRDFSQADWDAIKVSEYDLEDWLFNTEDHAFINTVSARMAIPGQAGIISDAKIKTVIDSQLEANFDGTAQTFAAPALAVNFLKADMKDSPIEYLAEKSVEIQEFMDSAKAQDLKFMTHVKQTGNDDAEFKISLYSITENDTDMTTVMDVFKNDFEFKQSLITRDKGAYIAKGLLGYKTNGVGDDEDKFSIIQDDVTLQGSAGTNSNPHNDRYVEDSMVSWNSYGPKAGKKASVKAALYQDTNQDGINGDIDTYVSARYIIDRESNIPSLKLDVYRVKITGTTTDEFEVLGTDTLYLKNDFLVNYDQTTFDNTKKTELKEFIKDNFNFKSYYELTKEANSLVNSPLISPSFTNIKTQVLNYASKRQLIAATYTDIIKEDFLDKLIAKLEAEDSFSMSSLWNGLEIFNIKKLSADGAANAGTRSHILYYWLNVITTELSLLLNSEIADGNITPVAITDLDDFYDSLVNTTPKDGTAFNEWMPDPISEASTSEINVPLHAGPGLAEAGTKYQYKIDNGQWTDSTLSGNAYFSFDNIVIAAGELSVGSYTLHVRQVLTNPDTSVWIAGSEPVDKVIAIEVTNSLPTISFHWTMLVGTSQIQTGPNPQISISTGHNESELEALFDIRDDEDGANLTGTFTWSAGTNLAVAGSYTVTGSFTDSNGGTKSKDLLVIVTSA